MYIQQLIEEGADIPYLERLFHIERYAWLSLSYDMAAVIDLEGCFVAVNTHWERYTGYSPSELRGSYLLEYIDIEDREKTLAEMQKLITSDLGTASFVFNFLCKDDIPKRLSWNMVFSPEHNTYFGVVKDVDESNADSMLRYAYKDVLTGLHNRLHLTDNFPEILSRAQSMGWTVGVMFIDLDGFKAVNDTYGHNSGDLLLMEVANRLKACGTETDTFIRLGGDEFLVILCGEITRECMARTAHNIISRLGSPFTVDDNTVTIGASVGVSIFPKNSTTPEELIQMADTAMYDVKNTGKNNFAFYGENGGDR